MWLQIEPFESSSGSAPPDRHPGTSSTQSFRAQIYARTLKLDWRLQDRLLFLNKAAKTSLR